MIVLLSVIALAYCYSNGEIDECNATSPLFGCKTWKITNGVEQRVDGCLDANADKLIMDWVSKPVRSDLYELFAGSEDAKLTKYIPGQRLPIGLRVKKFQGNYRGILLYALDDKGQKIGTWSFIDRVTTFHQFEACPNSVLHVNGVTKPYLQQWYITIPAATTGQIRFQALVKVGPANDGAFFWPRDLVLSQDTASLPVQTVFRSLRNESCTEACARLGGTCDAAALETAVSSEATLAAKVAPFVVCDQPYIIGCDAQGAFQSTSGYCGFAGTMAACTALDLPYTKPTCASRSNAAANALRLCPCTGVTAKPTAAPPTASKTPTASPTASKTPTATASKTPTASPTGSKTPTASPTATPSSPTATPPSNTQCTPGTVSCVCDAAGACPDTALRCRSNVCVSSRCLYGEAGCPCDVDNDKCASPLICSSTKVCVNDGSSGSCPAGEAGCACTSADGCLSEDLVCTSQGTNKYCTRKIQTPCPPGDVGCPCVSGRCKDDTLECVNGASGDVCTFAQTTKPVVDDSGASTLSIASLLLVALTLLQF